MTKDQLNKGNCLQEQINELIRLEGALQGVYNRVKENIKITDEELKHLLEDCGTVIGELKRIKKDRFEEL